MLAENLLRARHAAGLSKNRLHLLSGIGLATIAEIEAGQTVNPGILTMARLANILGIRLDDLLIPRVEES